MSDGFRHQPNRYMYHWLSPEALAAFDASGIIKPYWRHWVIEAGRHVRGISTCEIPMLWNADDEKPREPCIVIDLPTVKHPVHAISSSQSFWLTRDIRNAKRRGDDPQKCIDAAISRCKGELEIPDEYFIEGPLTWENVVALGCEEETGSSRDVVEALSRRRFLPVIDMEGWQVGYPGYTETDGIVDEAVAEMANAAMAARP